MLVALFRSARSERPPSEWGKSPRWREPHYVVRRDRRADQGLQGWVLAQAPEAGSRAVEPPGAAGRGLWPARPEWCRQEHYAQDSPPSGGADLGDGSDSRTAAERYFRPRPSWLPSGRPPLL